MPTERHLDGGNELTLLERLHEIRKRAGIARPLDEIALAERGEDQHRGAMFRGDLSRRGEAIEARHLDVEDGEIGFEVADELHALVPATGPPHHVVTLLF